MADVGRPSELTEEMLVKIKGCILEGKNHKETAEYLDIPYDTFEGWIKRNYDRFADTILTYKQERRLRMAEVVIDETLVADVENTGVTKKGDTFTFTDPKIMQVKSQTAMFVAETLGRQEYHKKKELDHTGEFVTYEIIRGDEDTSRPVSATDPAVAQGSVSAVGSVAV